MNHQPKVLNRYKLKPGETGVYCGRGSPWGNPFVIGKDGTRDEVCDKYEDYAETMPDLATAMKEQLKGKNLICFCKPCRCHCDTILRIANEE